MTDSIINWVEQPLGKTTDAALAAKLGVTTARVTHARRRLGIPGLRVVKEAERLAGPSKGDIDWSKQPLGKMSDLDIAKALGTHRARVRWARVYRGIPLFVEVDALEAPGNGGPVDRQLEAARMAQWYGYPVTADPCRYCTEARHRRALRGKREQMARWTDQGPACADHYASLPSCSKCSAPAAVDGDLCEGCLSLMIRAEREARGWRQCVPSLLPALDRGDVDQVRKGLRAFDRRQEKLQSRT